MMSEEDEYYNGLIRHLVDVVVILSIVAMALFMMQ
jgi:hypothetical protein